MIRPYPDSNPSVYEYSAASAPESNDCDLEISLRSRIEHVVEKWFSAQGFQTSALWLLYQETEKTINDLKNIDDLVERRVVKKLISSKFNLHSKEHDCEALAKWVGEHSSHEPGPGMGYIGAINTLKHLLDAAELDAVEQKDLSDNEFIDLIFEPEDPKHLNYVINRSQHYIEELKLKTLSFGYDFDQEIFSKLGLPDLISLHKSIQESHSNKDSLLTIDEFIENNLREMNLGELLAFMKTDEYNEAFVLNELVERWNEDEIRVDSISQEFTVTGKLDGFMNFFGDKCDELLHLKFDNLTTKDFNKLAKRFPKLERLSCGLGQSKIAPLNHSFNSLQSLHINKIRSVNSLKNILNHCPNITKFSCGGSNINVFDVLKDYPSIENVVLFDLEAKNSFNKDEKIFNVKQLNILNSDEFSLINFALPELTYLDLVGLELSKIDFSFLVKSTKLETIIVNNCADKTDFLNFCPSLKNLHLYSIPFAHFPMLEKSIQPKQLHIKYCHDREMSNLSKLLNFPSIETLVIENSDVKGFEVLKDHPSLKTVYISECTNMETAETLRVKGINVFYKLPSDASG